jgi:polar amino acid transport system substrate-binding protein
MIKRNKMKILVVALIVLFHSVNFIKAENIKTVNVCWEDGLKPPYLMLNEQNQPIGIAVELVTKILSSRQITIDHIILPWKRCLLEIQKGDVDIVPNASFKKERAEFALYTKPLYATHLALFYKKSQFTTKPEITTVSELSRYVVGGVLGFNYSFYQGKLEIDTGAISREALFIKLIKNRIDFAIAQKEVIFSLNKEGKVILGNIGYIPDLMRPLKEYHILVGKKHPNSSTLKQILDSGIEAMYKNGYYEEVIRKYLGAVVSN